MRIALTGTPGVGKSTLAAMLRDRGEAVVDLNEWAAEHGAIASVDADGTKVIDTNAVDLSLFPSHCFIDSHMAHVLDVDLVWLVRCDPAILRGRLEARGYTSAKVTENLEAEAMDLILQECMEADVPVIQRDGSHRNPMQLLAAFDEAATDTPKASDLEPIDWSDRLLDGL